MCFCWESELKEGQVVAIAFFILPYSQIIECFALPKGMGVMGLRHSLPRGAWCTEYDL